MPKPYPGIIKIWIFLWLISWDIPRIFSPGFSEVLVIPGFVFEVPEIIHDKFSYILGSILWTFRRCVFKLEDWLQRYWHKWQANGFSPVWILMWFCKLVYDFAWKLHIWQAWGFVSDLEVIVWYWNNIGYTSMRAIINYDIFSPLFHKHFQEKTNWINDTFIYQSFWKRNQLYFGFNLVNFS